MNTESANGRSGYVAIVGRPNVGKSTLLNALLGQKISITSRKPQTTRHRVLGIKTRNDVQTMYVDTPGLHEDQGQALNRYMNKAAVSALQDVDLVIFVTDCRRWKPEDERVLAILAGVKCPVVLALNKVDLLESKSQLLPQIEAVSAKKDFSDIVPLCALKPEKLGALETLIESYMPEGGLFFPADQITDRSERFLAAELVREKITRRLGEEIPYQVTVEIEQFRRDGKVLHINALILVERDGQKRIIIGRSGERLRDIGRDARLDMERLFDSKVMLKLWVKVKSGWSDDERALRSLGYDD